MGFAAAGERVVDAAISALHATRPHAVVGEHLYLSGLFAPVLEEHTAAEIAPSAGAIPPGLNGVYARVGPNPRWKPSGQYHLFDGDGAVFSVRLQDGVAKFSNAWVRTARFMVELDAGRSCFPMLGDMHGATGLAILALHQAKASLGGPCSTPLAMGTANTALEFHAGRLLALQEGSLPWHLRVLCDGALETIGACTFDGAAPRTFTAHPKVDAQTGEMLFISYQVDKTPHLTYGVLDADGKPVHVTPIPLRFPQMLHDFAVTQSYAVFWDLPLAFEPKEMVASDKLPFVYEKSRGSAFGVLPRRSEGSATRWFSLPGCMIFHSLACWEEEEAQLVRLFAARIEDFDLTLPPAGKTHDVRSIDGGFPTLYEFVLDLRSGEASQSVVVPLPEGLTGMDFPKAHPHLTGAKVRYGYLALFTGLVITGVAKVDLETRSICGRIDYPDGACGGEAYFVPATEGAPGPGQEDDGWLFTYVSTEAASSLWIMDAKTMAATPTAVLPLPTRVPWGFHSKWVPQAQLATQRASR